MLVWLPSYNWRQDAPRDLVGGLTTVSILIPQGLAFASLAEQPLINGLMTAFVPCLIYSVLGMSRHLSVGPEAIVSLMVGNAVLTELSVDPNVNPVIVATTLSLCSGLILLLLGLLRFGFIESVLSRPLVRGFISAVAFVVVSEQLAAVSGLPISPQQTALKKYIEFFTGIPTANTATLAIAACTIVFLFAIQIAKLLLAKRMPLTRYFPTVFFVVLITTVTSYFAKFDTIGVKILGNFDSGFPKPDLPIDPELDTTRLLSLFVGSCVIALVGFVESILGAQHHASRQRYSVSANRELVALGLCNFVGSFFGCWPAFGSLPRTGVSVSAGSRTQLSNVFAAIIVLLTMLFLTKLFYYLPVCVMGAIIFHAALNLLHIGDLIFLVKLRAWSELLLFVLMLTITFFVGIQEGLGSAMLLSLFMHVKHGNKSNKIKQFGVDNYTHQLAPVGNPNVMELKGDVVVRIEESVFFGNIRKIRELISRIDRYGNTEKHPSSALTPAATARLVIDMSRVLTIDTNALIVLKEIVTYFQAQRTEVYFVGVHDRRAYTRSGIESLVGSVNFFENLDQAIDELELLTQHHESN